MTDYRKLRDLVVIEKNGSKYYQKLNALEDVDINLILIMLSLDISIEWDEQTFDLEKALTKIKRDSGQLDYPPWYPTENSDD